MAAKSDNSFEFVQAGKTENEKEEVKGIIAQKDGRKK